MPSNQVRSPSGQLFTINEEGRKMDEDGFMCSSKTPGSRSLIWFCVSVKREPDKVMVRDTKDPTKTTLTFTPEEWKAFVEGVKSGEFDI